MICGMVWGYYLLLFLLLFPATDDINGSGTYVEGWCQEVLWGCVVNMCCGNRATAAGTEVQQMTPGVVTGPYNNFFNNFYFIGYVAVDVFVGVVNPFEVQFLI